MKGHGKRGLLLGLFVILLSVSAQAAANFSAQDGYDWLADQASSDGSFNSDVYITSLAILALDQAGYDTSASEDWLYSQLDAEDNCFPSGSCSIKDTSAAVLALNEVQDSSYFELIDIWYADVLEDADVTGNWYLEVVTSSSGTCTISYEKDGEVTDVSINVEEGTFPDCGDSNFLDLDECIQANLITTNPGILLDIDCGSLEGNVVLTLLYKSDSTYYLLGNENAATAEFQVNNGCFPENAGGSCNLESSLYAGWALTKIPSNEVNTLIYLKEKYVSTDPVSVALTYLTTKDTTYLADLADLQKSDGSFDRDPFATGVAILALSDDTTYSQNVEDAKSFLREEQSDDGSWGASVEDTAMALYGAFGEEEVSPGAISADEEIVSECDTDSDCESLYGSGYVCDDGTCTTEEAAVGCSTDDDCSSGEVCLSSECITSDCDYGQYCESGQSCCDYGKYNENAENCPSDCYCDDGVCDDTESATSCPDDCEEEEEEVTTTTTTTTAECSSDDDCDSGEQCLAGECVEEEGGGFLTIVIILILLIGLGVGGYFAYKKGMLDTILSKFKKGPKGPQPGQPGYTPFTSRLPQQPQQKPAFPGTQSPFGGGQPKSPFGR